MPVKLKWAVRVRKSRRIPYGWDVADYDEKLLLPDQEMLDKLHEAYKYWKTGDYSHRKLAEWLNGQFGEKRTIHYNGLLSLFKNNFPKWLKLYREREEKSAT